MARDRIISPEQQKVDQTIEVTPTPSNHRPGRIEEYVGQRDLVERLSIALTAARARSEPVPHVLLDGPPGLGKTTMAHIIGTEMGTRVTVTSGPTLSKGSDLVGTLTKMNAGDVLFIDEIHRLPRAVEEYIYPAMEDYRIDFVLDSGIHARSITYSLEPFTLIGATTRAGLLTDALRSRFGISHTLDYYPSADLKEILTREAARLSLSTLAKEALETIASRSRGTPRVALRLLHRVRDFAQVRASGVISGDVVEEALSLEGVDDRGLDSIDRRYMATIADVYEGGPVGLEAIGATMGQNAGTLEFVVEPYLLRVGFLARTRQGRKLTRAGQEHLKSCGVRFEQDAS